MISAKVPLSGNDQFDPEVLGQVYDLYSPGLFRYAYRLLGDEQLAEECVSETFSRYLTMLRANRGAETNLRAYLYRIAHNWITDSYRKHSPTITELDEDAPDFQTECLEIQAENRLEQQKIRSALACLTPDQRQVIMLRFIEGWENKEVAAALKKPVSAIKALQHRAIVMIRKMVNA